MDTGARGTFAVSWARTEIDGILAAPRETLVVGASWRRMGRAVRLDGAQGLLQLRGFEGEDEMRRRAARAVRRLIGVAPDRSDERADAAQDDPGSDAGFVVTDGSVTYEAEVVEASGGFGPLVVFSGAVPPERQELWVVRVSRPHRRPGRAETTGGVICFTPGTYLATPAGPRAIETLAPGDLLCTRDNGPQPIVWCGHRRMSGARLFAMPHLRPIRIRSNAFGIGQPDRELIVSPQHRMLVCGTAAETLFGTDEVLVAAEDLLTDRSVTVDHHLREVTYVHVLLERHQIVWANGLKTESFHPAHAAPEAIDPVQRQALIDALPALASDPLAYGDVVRRYLTGAEAAILRHRLAA